LSFFARIILPHRLKPESNNYASVQKFEVGEILFLKYSYAHQGCIYLNKNTVINF